MEANTTCILILHGSSHMKTALDETTAVEKQRLSIKRHSKCFKNRRYIQKAPFYHPILIWCMITGT